MTEEKVAFKELEQHEIDQLPERYSDRVEPGMHLISYWPAFDENTLLAILVPFSNPWEEVAMFLRRGNGK